MNQLYLKKAFSIDSAQLDEASRLIKYTIENGRIVYLVSGDMHSNAVFLPFFVPGMPCALSPMTEPTLSNTVWASRAYYLRDAKNVGHFLCGYYRSLCPGDTMLLADCGESLASAEILAFAEAHEINTVHVSPAPGKCTCAVPLEGIASVAQLSLAIGDVSFQILSDAVEQMDNPDVWLPFTKENDEKNEALFRKYRPLVKKL